MEAVATATPTPAISLEAIQIVHSMTDATVTEYQFRRAVRLLQQGRVRLVNDWLEIESEANPGTCHIVALDGACDCYCRMVQGRACTHEVIRDLVNVQLSINAASERSRPATVTPVAARAYELPRASTPGERPAATLADLFN